MLKEGIRAIALAAVLAAGSATLAAAQVRELPVPFDSAGAVTVLTMRMADSLGLRPPAWPVVGQFAEARLHRQDQGGYIVVVRRPDGSIDRFSISLEQVAAIRERFLGREARVVIAEPAPGPPEPRVAPSVLPPAVRVADSERSASRSFGNGQVLLATAVYGPALALATMSVTDDQLVHYGAWFGTIGAALYVVRRPAEVSLAQSILSNHAGLHGAGIGAALAFIASGKADSSNRAAYGLGMFAGGVGGAFTAYQAARKLTPPQAAAAALAADVGLFAGTMLAVSAYGDEFDNAGAATLIAGTMAGYLLGPIYPRVSRDNVTTGDVIALISTAITGTLAAGTVLSATDASEGSANVLTIGMLAGLAAGHPLLARPMDHSIAEAGQIIAATLGGAYIGMQLGSLGNEGRNEARVLTLATIGSAGAIWAIERRFALDRPSARMSHAPRPRSHEGTAWPSMRVNPVAGAMLAARAPGQHAVVRFSF